MLPGSNLRPTRLGSVTFSPTLAELRDEVDRLCVVVLEDRKAAIDASDLLVDELLRLVRAGGKRLRPSFCYWGFRAAGVEPDERILAAAAALEVLHTFAIVHDDIMDGAHHRRGEETINLRHGDDVALLAGDLALVIADRMFLTAGFSDRAATNAYAAYARMREQVIAGQFLELTLQASAGAGRAVSVEDASRVALLKSALYSVEEPLLIGAALAGADEELSEQLRAFGRPVGEAFQLRDDLLGTFGDPLVTGKPVDADAREGKANFLYAATRSRLQPAERRELDRLWGSRRALSGDELETIRSLIEASGARTEALRLLDVFVERARDALSALPIDEETRAALSELVAIATQGGDGATS